jgi:NAD+ kinase
MKIQTIGIIVKDNSDAVATTLRTLHDFLVSKSCKILLDPNAEGLLSKDIPILDRATLGKQSDLAIVIGGDGTFLSAVRALVDYNVPILGINLGRLGFLVDIYPDEMLHTMEQILDGEYVEETRFLLSAQVVRDNKILTEANAFNDVVIHIRDVARMIEFKTWINGQYVHYQRADGIVISTPTGSTAYALSGGGPLLHATLDAIVLVPICPHTLSNRPLVVNADSEIDIEIGENRQSTAQVSFDGQNGYDVLPGDTIRIRRKKNAVRLVHPAQYDYYHILRYKLRWSEQL